MCTQAEAARQQQGGEVRALHHSPLDGAAGLLEQEAQGRGTQGLAKQQAPLKACSGSISSARDEADKQLLKASAGL